MHIYANLHIGLGNHATSLWCHSMHIENITSLNNLGIINELYILFRSQCDVFELYFFNHLPKIFTKQLCEVSQYGYCMWMVPNSTFPIAKLIRQFETIIGTFLNALNGVPAPRGWCPALCSCCAWAAASPRSALTAAVRWAVVLRRFLKIPQILCQRIRLMITRSWNRLSPSGQSFWRETASF